MNPKIILTLIVVGFCLLCGFLVAESGLFQTSTCDTAQPCILLQQTVSGENNQTPIAEETPQLQPTDSIIFGADNAPAANITIGSTDPRSGFQFLLELTSKGAAIERATLSGFDDRDYKDPQPLVLLSPVTEDILPMANREIIFVNRNSQLPLHKLHWANLGTDTGYDGSQSAAFEAIVKDESTGKPIIKLVKTYKIIPGSYMLDCSINVENLSNIEQKIRLNLAGPVGLGREGVRGDMRKAVAGFKDAQGQVTSVRLDIRKLRKARTIEDRLLAKPGDNFIWLASTSKYFAAILVPLADEGEDYCKWALDRTARYYNPDRDQKGDSGDEAVGVDLKIAPKVLAAAGEANSKKAYNFKLYLGPKDKTLFDENEYYKKLGFVHTIDFLACCCPVSVISPLAFGIFAIMRWMYMFIPNYGVVIIIFVFFIRIALHPLTKKGQLSMSKMGQLGPKAEELKKKYANDKAELNKRIMALYKEEGVSPISGMLPMMVQMPVWIALYSAIYASIELRGAPFLPFWITDLSAPDALVRFATITLPIFGKISSFNLLPIMMGVAFYLQQKLMPKPAAATSNPQMAQQQKMMM
ncbi:MAG: YidC/Oxa1 family insertase periplasmic-domain containing protein, partial [Planctomycetes bacterium]|nr:YidC/Oxa1 family insertase periplasmic-domain containing protein [Planctomycetota bacterium]